MTMKCECCGAFNVEFTCRFGNSKCSWCQAVASKAGKETTAAECYERARWERFMGRKIEEKIRSGEAHAGYSALVEAHRLGALNYQKLGDERRTTDRRYIMFLDGMFVLNTPTINFEKQWYSGEEKRRPEGWYHVDETMTELYGPFDSDVEADQSMKRYIAGIQRPETD